jgi:hypothetical protein
LISTDSISTEICEDVKEECEKYGKVLDMKVPRPTGGSRQSNGVGKIFVKFDTPESAGKALRALAGRKFADRTVVTTYFSEVSILLAGPFIVLTYHSGKFRGGGMVIGNLAARYVPEVQFAGIHKSLLTCLPRKRRRTMPPICTCNSS